MENSVNDTRRWWQADDDRVPALLKDILASLRQNQSVHMTQRQWSQRLYQNATPINYWGLTSNNLVHASPAARARLRINVIKMVCDTVQAKIAKNRPEPLYLSSGGDYKEKRRAQKLNRFIRGIFEENQVAKLMPRAFMAACLDGSTFVHVFEEYGRIKMLGIPADEIWVDEMSCLNSEPRQMFRVKVIERLELAALFPEHKDAIEAAKPVSSEELGSTVQSPISDLLQVCEGWKLKSSPESDDGVHILAIEDKVLLREEWTRERFPFMHFVWSQKPKGYYGLALAEELEPIQLSINQLCATVQESIMVGGTFKVWVKTGSNINTNAINDEIGTIIESDEMPQYITPELVGPEIYALLETLQQKAFSTARLSQMSVNGQNPLGPNASGAAIREMEYVEGDGFSIVAQFYEHAHLDLARLIVDTATEMADRGVKLETKATRDNGHGFDTVRLQDIHIDAADKFVLQLFPISSLPNTPAARMQTLTEMTAAGWIDPRRARRLMNFPDLESAFTLLDSVEERIHDMLEKIIDDGDYDPPDAYLDLQTAKELSVEYINVYARMGLEEQKLELLRTWSEQVDMLIKRAMQPPPGAAAGPMGTPQVPGMPPQKSPMVQNQPGVQGMPQ